MSRARKVSDEEIKDSGIAPDEIMYDDDGNKWISTDIDATVNPLPGATDQEHDELEHRLDHLTPKQRFVIECSWGLAGRANWDGPLSFRQIGYLMGISHVAVKNLYDKGMKHLREEGG